MLISKGAVGISGSKQILYSCPTSPLNNENAVAGWYRFNNAVYIKSIIPLTNECRLFYHLVHSWKGKNDKN